MTYQFTVEPLKQRSVKRNVYEILVGASLHGMDDECATMGPFTKTELASYFPEIKAMVERLRVIDPSEYPLDETFNAWWGSVIQRPIIETAEWLHDGNAGVDHEINGELDVVFYDIDGEPHRVTVTETPDETP